MQCIDPEPKQHMKHDYTGTPYEIGYNATYTCDEGFYFEDDRDRANVKAECLNTGSFKGPDPWPKCVTGRRQGC